jgi:hypothetical protein
MCIFVYSKQDTITELNAYLATLELKKGIIVCFFPVKVGIACSMTSLPAYNVVSLFYLWFIEQIKDESKITKGGNFFLANQALKSGYENLTKFIAHTLVALIANPLGFSIPGTFRTRWRVWPSLCTYCYSLRISYKNISLNLYWTILHKHYCYLP